MGPCLIFSWPTDTAYLLAIASGLESVLVSGPPKVPNHMNTQFCLTNS